MPNKNLAKQGTSTRRSPRLSVGNEDTNLRPTLKQDTPMSDKPTTDKKRQRSEEELKTQKRECRNDTVEVRGSAIFYDSHDTIPNKDLPDKSDKLSKKNIKAIKGVCLNEKDEEVGNFTPKHTSTDCESSSEDESMENSSRRAPGNSTSMDDLVRSMAIAFQTSVVQDGLRTALEPHFNRIIVSLEEYKDKTDKRILYLEKEVAKIKPLEDKVASLQTMIEDHAQEPKNLNLLVTGLTDNDTLKDQCLTVASELELDPYKLDIIDVKKMPPTRKRDAPTRYRIRFGDILLRTSFYKARTRPSCKIWMNEDLCQSRAKLAYQARQVVFHKKAVRTWTYLGKIFIIYTENMTPILVNRFEELPAIETANNKFQRD